MITMPWPYFRDAIRKLSARTRFVELPQKYILRGWDESFIIQCELDKRENPKHTLDFETTYKTTFNNFDVNKGGAFSTPQTNLAIWTPAAGKRLVLTNYIINVRNSTLSAQTFTIFEETNASDNRVLSLSLAAGENFILNSPTDSKWVSLTADNKLKLTTTGNLIVNGRFKGYEVF